MTEQNSNGSVPPHHHAHDERSRRRRTSRHLLLSIAAVALFGSAIIALAWVEGGVPSPNAGPSGSPSPSPTIAELQPTVLIQASSSTGAEVNLLTSLSAAEEPSAIMLWMPPALVVSAPKTNSESIRTTVSSIDTLRAPLAVSATIGVRVDGSWRLGRKALAGLVDAAGGIKVNLAKPIRIQDRQGEIVVTLPAGKQTLTGADASWYAVGVVVGDTPADERDRGMRVFRQSLAALPVSVTAVRETLTALGALAPTTIGAQTLAEYLVDFGAALRRGEQETLTLPTTEIAIGPNPFQWTDFRQATPLLRDVLPLAQWNAKKTMAPRVLVMSGESRPGLIGSTRVAVENLGYVFVDGRGTTIKKAEKSRVLVRGLTEWGPATAQALGLPEGSVSAASEAGELPKGKPWADVDVQLQEDYEP